MSDFENVDTTPVQLTLGGDIAAQLKALDDQKKALAEGAKTEAEALAKKLGMLCTVIGYMTTQQLRDAGVLRHRAPRTKKEKPAEKEATAKKPAAKK